MAIPTITLYPEAITNIGPISVTNDMIGFWGTCIALILFAFWMRRGMALIPTRRQVAFEGMMGMMMEKMMMLYGTEERSRKFFPWFFTLFIFLLFANQFTLIPFIQSVVTSEGVVLVGTPTSHYTLTITLAVLVVVVANVLAFMQSPAKHLGAYFKFSEFLKVKKAGDLPLAFANFGIGLLDIVGEFAKILSLSTRLFGNLIAGEVIILIVSGLMFYTQFFVPIPFIVLGIASGLVQAFVFAMLAMIFTSLTLSSVE